MDKPCISDRLSAEASGHRGEMVRARNRRRTKQREESGNVFTISMFTTKVFYVEHLYKITLTPQRLLQDEDKG